MYNIDLPYHDPVVGFAIEVSSSLYLTIMFAFGLTEFKSKPDARAKVGSTNIFDNSHFLKNELKLDKYYSTVTAERTSNYKLVNN